MNFFKNGKTLRLLILYASVFAAIWACEEEDEPIVSDPSVSIFFLNNDSLDKVSFIVDSLDIEKNIYDSTISTLEDSADLLADSLIVLTDSIANGGDLKLDSTVVAENIIKLNTNLDLIQEEDSAVNAQYSAWSSVVSVINSGLVKISSIQNNKNGQVVTYEDSSTSWKLPLDMQADNIDVDISIEGDETYNLMLSYDQSTAANEKNKVVIKTSNFKIVSTDFNNASLSCEGCEDSKTAIHVEF